MPDTDAAPPSTPTQRAIGDISPKLANLTDSGLFGNVWERSEMSKRDRSLATVAALIAMKGPKQLRSHLVLAHRSGMTQQELIETINHLAVYSVSTNGVTAITVAKEAFPAK